MKTKLSTTGAAPTIKAFRGKLVAVRKAAQNPVHVKRAAIRKAVRAVRDEHAHMHG